MLATLVEHPPVAPLLPLNARSETMSRPPVGIERLPARRPTNEPRESMNCKSCRKRKVWNGFYHKKGQLDETAFTKQMKADTEHLLPD